MNPERSTLAHQVKDRLGHGELDPRHEQALDMAELYREFPPIKNAVSQLIEILNRQDADPEFVQSVTVLLNNLEAGASLLETSYDYQREQGLSDHQWKTADRPVNEALQRGVRTVELDLRLDKDGSFWVSHSPKDSKFLGRQIHELSTDEMAVRGRRENFEQVVKDFARYAQRDGRLILDIKTLGPDPAKFPEYLQKLKILLKRNAVEGNIAACSFSPGLLMALHEQMPDTPLMLSGGLVPMLSYPEPPQVMHANEPEQDSWHALKLGGVELVYGNASKTVQRPDGHGVQTAYVYHRLPDDILDVLKAQRTRKQELGGIISLGAIVSTTHLLETLGFSQKAEQMRRYYGSLVKELGLGAMAVAWAESLPVERLSAANQLRVLREQFGFAGSESVFMSQHPEVLAPEVQALINN